MDIKVLSDGSIVLIKNTRSYRVMVKGNGSLLFNGDIPTDCQVLESTIDDRRKLISSLIESNSEEAKSILRGLNDRDIFGFRELILVRNSKRELWNLAEYVFTDQQRKVHVLGGLSYLESKPYIGNENLLGKLL